MRQGAYGCRWGPTHNGHGTIRLFLPNEWQDFPHKIIHSVDIWHPVHGTNKDHVDLRIDSLTPVEIVHINACRYIRGFHSKQLPHQPGVLRRDSDDVCDCLTNSPLPTEHTLSLSLEVSSAQRVGRVFCVAPPDHGLDVVLKQKTLAEVFKVRSR